MAIVTFREPGGAYTARNLIRGYYARLGQTYDPKSFWVEGRKLYSSRVPADVLKGIAQKVEPSVKVFGLD